MEVLKNIQAPPQHTSLFNEGIALLPKTVCFRISKKQDGNIFQTRRMVDEMLAENYLSARTLLVRLLENNSKLPDIIIIDLSYSSREVTCFVEWLNKTPEFSFIPVVYNRSVLQDHEVREITALHLVDDIIDLDMKTSLLPSKAMFLKEAKKQQFASQVEEAAINAKTTAEIIDHFLRRTFDILIASILILLLLPVFVLITLLILIESRGPVIYSSDRAGKGYKVFKFLKFRTMYVGADNKRLELEKLNLYKAEGSVPQFFKIKNDPRVTKVGTILRNTSLDELPQLFNVLKGDMSIVGNRPLPLYEAATLTTNEWAERFMAPAGITGLWQIMKRGREDMSVEERISLDISYAKDNHLMKDLWIILKTPTALFQKTNV